MTAAGPSSDADVSGGAGPVSWRSLLDRATAVLGERDDARRIVETASGWSGATLAVHLDDPCTVLGHSRYTAMVARRSTGEPLQYVLGGWGFRRLDLMVDRRVLIPRPETEWVVEAALAEVDRLAASASASASAPGPAAMTAVDLGTGSGAIALSLATERTGLAVWATDVSADALAVARANLAGVGRAATRVRIVPGDWFEALPADLRGGIDLIVSNPPYVAATDDLPPEVRDWEPTEALVPGPRGLEAIEVIVAQAPAWLRRPGALVVEIGEAQGEAALAAAGQAGFADCEVRPDLAGRDRVLVARLAAPSPSKFS
ncbi:MAG: peptide chain release factor N(5)-glutamine methyltransferase [Acidimicrobiia bacterium]